MVGLPFIADQHKNVRRLNKWNIGMSLNPLEMTSDELTEAIVQVATIPRFV